MPIEHGSVGDANGMDQSPSPVLTASIITTASDAGTATMAALADDLAYTLTAGQALECYAAARRKVPSLRTMQRYCIEGRVAAQKIRTTYGSEWLINEASLATLIEAEPIVAAVASVADVHTSATTATPSVLAPLITTTDTPVVGGAGDADDDNIAAPVGDRKSVV